MRNVWMTLYTLLAVLLAARATALETTEILLRHGETTDGLVGIVRDESGNMMLRDAVTTPTALFDLVQAPTSHGALSGLDQDHHPQYLNAARHAQTHSASFNAALPIPPDAALNETLGGHVQDEDIHLHRTHDETIEGEWTFLHSLRARGGTVRMGTSQFFSQPALLFADSPTAAELRYDTTAQAFIADRSVRAPALEVEEALEGAPGSALSGFSTVAGIAAGDLLSATREETIAAPWHFLAALTAEERVGTPRLDLAGLPAVTLYAVNASTETITAGSALRFAGIVEEAVGVAPLTESLGANTPWAGVALESADPQEAVPVILLGVAESPAGGSITAGDALTWNGSAMVPGTPSAGFALEMNGGIVRFWLRAP